MALKWIIGDFATGNTSMTAAANQLPVVANSGDKVNIDINGAESATIAVSKKDLPSDWRTFLKPLDKFVALVDPDLAWGSSVIWAGFINKAQAAVNDTVKIQAAGLREYMAMRIVSKTYNSTVSNPDTTITFNGSTHQRLMANMILDCFSSSGIPSSAPKPPQVLRSVSGSGSGTTYSHSVNLGDFEPYSNMLDAWRDELSDAGQEYKFTPSWDSSTMTRIRWTGAVAPVSAPHFNEATTYSIDLNSDAWMPTAYSQSSSTDNMVSRIIGQSKSGEGDTGSDYTTKTTTSGSSILVDETWNPGVELTTAEMTTQLTQRLSYNSQTYKEASFERAYSTVADLRTIMGYLGGTATFTGSGASQYFGLTMRIVGLSFSPSKRIVSIDLAPKAARYPRLPKDRRNVKPRQETVNTGRPRPGVGGLPPGVGGVGGPGDYSAPITPAPKPGYNGTTPIPGGIPKPPEPVIPPPFTSPINDKDVYEDEESVIENVDKRWFKPSTVIAAEADDPNIKSYWHPYPTPVKSRFNYKTGEYIGLNIESQYLYEIGADHEVESQASTTFPVKIYSMNIPQMFNRDSNPYKNEVQNTTTAYANDDSGLYVVGEIESSLYEDLIVSPELFTADMPSVYRDRSEYTSPTIGGFEYIFFCSEDLQTLYVQIVFSVSTVFRQYVSANSWIYSAALSKVLKGVRNSEGIVETWESLGQAFTKNPETETAEVFISNNIYEINGEMVSFGGYFIPQAEEQVVLDSIGGQVDQQKTIPHYAVKFYSDEFYDINPETPWSGNVIDKVIPEPNEYRSQNPSSRIISPYTIPYSVKVDYEAEVVVLGVVYGVNDKTFFYESSFKNNSDFVFTNVMDTNRLEGNPGKVSGFGGDTGYRYQGQRYSIFSHNNIAPIIYKNNRIVLSPGGGITTVNSSGLEYTRFDSRNQTVVGGEIKDKFISYLRGKKGFDDVLKGVSPEPVNTGSETNITGQKMDNMLNLTKIITNNVNSLYHYSSITNSRARSENWINKNIQGGWDYFVYDGYLYVIADSNLFDIQVPTNVDRDSIRFNYWVGKFKFKDELL